MIELAEIQQLPLHEKLKVMEALWDSLIQQEEQIEVPSWHKDLLAERENQVQQGKANFIDWETAKRQIREATL